MSNPTTTDLFLQESGELLTQALVKIRHCLSQLSTDQIWWRPFPEANSIGNLLLHISGNLRQWAISGVGGAEDDRDRPREFACRDLLPARELLEHTEATVDAARNIFFSLNADQLVETRTIQGFEVTVLGAIMHTSTHFVGHTHQIIYITRLILGDQYRFQWDDGGAATRLPV